MGVGRNFEVTEQQHKANTSLPLRGMRIEISIDSGRGNLGAAPHTGNAD